MTVRKAISVNPFLKNEEMKAKYERSLILPPVL